MSTSARERLPSYARLLEISQRGRWDPEQIDLDTDRIRWSSLTTAERARVRGLVAGFVVGEDAVADHLAPFAPADAHPDRAACLRAQQQEEEVHAVAVRRLWSLVAPTADADPRSLLDPAFVALFQERLPDVASRVGRDIGLAEAVALYHGLLEGVMFLAGQEALRAAADTTGLTGTLATIERIQRDERWHVALGMRTLVDLPDGEAVAAQLLAEAPAALDAWGALVSPADRDQTLNALRRRLRTVALVP